jgi:hypothetical protein
MRAGARARRLGIAALLALTASPARIPGQPLPDGLELLARPAPGTVLYRLADVDAEASRLVVDVGFGDPARATLIDASGARALPVPVGARGPTSALAISLDGAHVVGTAARSAPTYSGDLYAVVWHDGAPTLLPDLTAAGYSVASDVSADGRIVVGRSRLPGTPAIWRTAAVRWVDGVLETLPLPPDAGISTADLISDDGATIVGTVGPADASSVRLVRWRAGVVEDLPAAPPRVLSPVPMRLNSDGSVLLVRSGNLDGPTARLDTDGWTVIEDLPGGRQAPWIGAGSDDGHVVTGTATSGAQTPSCPYSYTCLDVNEAFVWTEETGTRRLKDLLIEGCGYPVEPWTIGTAWISRDAHHVIFGASGPDFPDAYVRASIEGCPLDHPEPDRRPKPGSIFASLYGLRAIYHIDPKGNFRLLASEGAIPQVLDVEPGPGRSLYVLGRGQLARVDIDDGETSLVASGGLMGSNASALAIGRDGVAYVLANGGPREARLVRIDPATGAQALVATFAGYPSELEREPGGTLAVLLAEGTRFELHRFDPADGSSTLWSSGATGGSFTGLAIGRDGELLMGFDSDSFQRLDPVTGIARRITSGPMRHGSLALDVDRSGALLFWDLPRIYQVRVDPDTGATSTGFGSVWFNQQASAAAVLHAQCSDGFDNDGDGRFDYPNDPGCSSAEDDSERVREDVVIDVEPFDANNLILLAGRRPIFVAVLGSGSVQANEIDPEGLTFGAGGARPREHRAKLLDVNRDGFQDAVLSFDSAEAGIAIGDREACLEGDLAGDAFRACDDIEVIAPGPCGHGFGLALVAPAVTWAVRRRKCAAYGFRWPSPTCTRSVPSKGGE